jgi:hypothetical protein
MFIPIPSGAELSHPEIAIKNPSRLYGNPYFPIIDAISGTSAYRQQNRSHAYVYAMWK